jgi:hypothetical protein
MRRLRTNTRITRTFITIIRIEAATMSRGAAAAKKTYHSESAFAGV